MSAIYGAEIEILLVVQEQKFYLWCRNRNFISGAGIEILFVMQE